MTESNRTLDQIPVTQLKGVGVQLAKKLSKLGIQTIQDVLFHLPLRYMDRTRITPIGSAQPNTEIVIEGEIRGCDLAFGRRRSLMCRLQDNTGIITLRFFHFSNAQRQNLTTGSHIRCYGEVKRGSSGLEIYHPEYQFIDQQQPQPLQQYLTAVYPATEGISQQRLRSIASQAFELMKQHSLTELLPKELQQSSLTEAIEFIHQPPKTAAVDQLANGDHPAQQRLAFEELLAHHLSLLQLRKNIQEHGAPALKCNKNGDDEKMRTQFLNALAFQLTDAQLRVSREILNDLLKPVPMLRLVQGDVGSGKTVVAALAALQCVAAGKQAAIMAPTEILAEQHRNSFQTWLEPLDIQLAWLTGKVKGKARERQLSMIKDGSAQIIIGTHALFQEEVEFHDLALTVIDEQHRFGVHQRLALKEKGRDPNQVPHQLIMTATPIPRTLAMSAYADLDCSTIDELPPGRSPVNTVVIANQRRPEIIERVRAACASGRQAYWVCTLIEESDVLEAQAAKATADELHLLLPELEIGLIHGRLKPGEKAAAMEAFKSGQLQLLVATTVIEVGVDVSNASLMVIENPERLGLAQLHQLRGRVGRGQQESHCVLLYSTPLSQHSTERLSIMRQTTDGFKIAEMDLKLRGPGEVLGTRQTGEMELRIADLQRDAHLLPQIKTTAETILAEYPVQAEAIIRRWLGGSERYGQV